MNVRVVLRVDFGVVLALGVYLLVPLVVSLLYRDGSWESFLVPAAEMMVAGVMGVGDSSPAARLE